METLTMVEEDKEIRYIASLLKARGWKKETIQRLLEMYDCA